MTADPSYTVTDPLDAAALQQLLTTQTFGRQLHILAQTASTNDLAKAMAQEHAPEGTVVLADQQTQGRGRQGRSFASPAGVGVYLSILLRPQIPLARLPQLTLLVAVAAADAITAHHALPVALKWPNDVHIQGKKVAGILTEGLLQATDSLAVIVGIGINVNTAPEQWPPELRSTVTSLALETGYRWPRLPFIAIFLARLEHLYGVFQHTGMAPILSQWLGYGRIIGQQVRFMQGRDTRTGMVLGLDEDGALLVRRDDGQQERIISGAVTFL